MYDLLESCCSFLHHLINFKHSQNKKQQFFYRKWRSKVGMGGNSWIIDPQILFYFDPGQSLEQGAGGRMGRFLIKMSLSCCLQSPRRPPWLIWGCLLRKILMKVMCFRIYGITPAEHKSADENWSELNEFSMRHRAAATHGQTSKKEFAS